MVSKQNPKPPEREKPKDGEAPGANSAAPKPGTDLLPRTSGATPTGRDPQRLLLSRRWIRKKMSRSPKPTRSNRLVPLYLWSPPCFEEKPADQKPVRMNPPKQKPGKNQPKNRRPIPPLLRNRSKLSDRWTSLSSEPISLIVEARSHGWRVDHFLSRTFANYSRALLQKAIENKAFS